MTRWCSEGNGTYVFPAVELQFTSPGQYQLVVVADGIASPPSTGVIDVQFTGAATSWDKARSYLVVFGLFLLCASIGIGNSKWHKARWMVVSLLVCVLGILLTIFVVQNTFAAQRILLYILFSMCGIVLLLLLTRRGLYGHDLGFHDVRTQTYVMYVRNMFNGVQRRRQSAELERYRHEQRVHTPSSTAVNGLKHGSVNGEVGGGAGQGLKSSGRRAGDSASVVGGPTGAASVSPVSPGLALCCYCQAAPPALTCSACKEVYCCSCSDMVHRGRLACHSVVPGVVPNLLPAVNLAAQRVRDSEQLWLGNSRRSYVVAMRQSLTSCTAQWRLWARTLLSRATVSPQEAIDANPEVWSCLSGSHDKC